jgi:hypothetical protein
VVGAGVRAEVVVEVGAEVEVEVEGGRVPGFYDLGIIWRIVYSIIESQIILLQ